MLDNQPSSPEAILKASLLVIDAHLSDCAVTVEHLRRKGYRVEQASSGDEALTRLQANSIDLVLLDVALPGADGVALMRRLRGEHPTLPIIVLTAQATVESAVAAVKLNVVDYLVKPCKIEDLLLTISRSLEERAQQLRQQRLLALVGEAMEALRPPEKIVEPLPEQAPSLPAPSIDIIPTDVLALDRAKRQLTLRLNPPRIIDLTEGELAVLVALMEKPNIVLSYNDLAKMALGYEGMDKWTVESVIRSTVFRLRHKIETGPDAPCLIRTVRGRGYFYSPV